MIVSVGSDFLVDQPESLRFTRQFAARRRVEAGQVHPNRLYVLESTPTLTGAIADHRFSAPPDRVAAVLHRLKGAAAGENLGARESAFVENLAADLAKHQGSVLVLTGETEPEEIRALASGLGGAPQRRAPSWPTEELAQLASDLENGLIKQLFILGGNPAYTTPADLHFQERMAKATFAVHLSLFRNETSGLCRWQVPEAHFLEAWSDILASDGTPSIVQPVIDPLYEGRSIHEFLSLLAGDFQPSGYEIVRTTWAAVAPGDFDKFWQLSVHDGVVKGTAPAAAPGREDASAANSPQLDAGADYLLIRPDPAIGDGRWANNGWLQELPKPLTKLTWDNAALIGPAMAQRLGLKTGDMVELQVESRSVEAPVMILPGHADRCVTVHLGYGRRNAGHLGSNRGFDAYGLQSEKNRWLAPGLKIRKTGGGYDLAITQDHFSMEGRDIVRVTGVDEFRANPLFAAPALPQPPSLLPAGSSVGHARYAWGLSVDLSTCIGCNACVIGLPGGKQHPGRGQGPGAKGREMHWIRIDAIIEGLPDNPDVHYQPVMCMQCEKAPCEPVCPVAATVHNDEGFNRWCITAALARATARTTARIRCAASISCNTPTPQTLLIRS